jgi:hypothetical protein
MIAMLAKIKPPFDLIYIEAFDAGQVKPSLSSNRWRILYRHERVNPFQAAMTSKSQPATVMIPVSRIFPTRFRGGNNPHSSTLLSF